MNIAKLFPVVYVVNSTNDVLRDFYFTFEGMIGADVRIKKVSKNFMEAKAIVTTSAKTYKNLFMYHYDKDNNKHEYFITDKIMWGNTSDIKIEILDINADGTYKLIIEENFVLK
jgi:hypothetical protein